MALSSLSGCGKISYSGHKGQPWPEYEVHTMNTTAPERVKLTQMYMSLDAEGKQIFVKLQKKFNKNVATLQAHNKHAKKHNQEILKSWGIDPDEYEIQPKEAQE